MSGGHIYNSRIMKELLWQGRNIKARVDLPVHHNILGAVSTWGRGKEGERVREQECVLIRRYM